MSYIRKLLTGAEERGTEETVMRIEADILERTQQTPPAPQEQKPMIVRVAQTYINAFRNYTAGERDLTLQIDKLVEERRQLRAAVGSAIAGLYPIVDDPAIPADMREHIRAIFDSQVNAVIDDADLKI